MSQSSNKSLKQIGPSKFLFHLNSKTIYFLTFDNVDLTNIEIILIKLCPKDTLVYKNIIPFQNLGTGDCSPQDTIKTLNFIVYNFDFTISDQYHKFVLSLNTKFKANVELFLYNKNMETNNLNKFLENKKQIDSMQSKIHELISIISNQKKKINELKQKEQNQIKLINKIEEVTNGIASQYRNNPNKNNNNNQQNHMNNNVNAKNNFNNMNQNDKQKNLLATVAPQSFKRNLDMNFSNANNLNNNNNKAGFNKAKTLNLTVNVKYSPYLPNNTNIDNLLTRPQNAYPSQPQQNFQNPRNINLDNIEDYRYK